MSTTPSSFNSNDNTPEQNSDHIAESSWQALIDTLLGKLNINYDVKITEKRIIITAKEADAYRIQQELQEALFSSSSFNERLPYTVEVNASVPSTQQAVPPSKEMADVTTPPPPQDTLEAGLEKFKRLFGAEAINNIALDADSLFDGKKGAYSKECIIYSKPAKVGKIKELWNDFLEALVASFNNVDISMLRKIWTEGGHHLPELPENFKLRDGEAFQGLIQQCFGVKEEEGQLRLFMNYGLLYRFIFPPQVEIQAPSAMSSLLNPNQEATVSLSKEHLLNYIQQITQKGALLRVYKENESSDQFMARPILLGAKAINPKSHEIIEILDRSGSMKGEKSQKLAEHVPKLAERLSKLDNKAKLRVVFFNDKQGPIKEFPIIDNEGITSFIEGVAPDGGTALFSTFESELRRLLNDKSKTKESTILLCSDGVDSDTYLNPKARAEAFKRIAELFGELEKEGIMPKCYTVGISNGNNADSYDHELLATLAEHCKTPFIHLKSIDDFKEIYKHTSSIGFERKLEEFFVGAERYTFPLMLDGNARSPGILFPFQKGEKRSIGSQGQSSTIQIPDSSKVPVATINDRLNAFHVRINTLVADDSPEKIKNLKEAQLLLEQFKKAYSLTETQEKTLAILQGKTENYLKDLKIVSDNRDHAFFASLQSQARNELGYYKALGTRPQASTSPGPSVSETTAASTKPIEVEVNPNPTASEEQNNFGTTTPSPAGRKLLSLTDEEEGDSEVHGNAAELENLQTSSASRRVAIPTVTTLVGLLRSKLQQARVTETPVAEPSLGMATPPAVPAVQTHPERRVIHRDVTHKTKRPLNLSTKPSSRASDNVKIIKTNSVTGASLVQMDGVSHYQSGVGSSHVFVNQGAQAHINGLKGEDRIYVPSFGQQSLTTCQDTPKGAVLKTEDSGVTLTADKPCERVLPLVTPVHAAEFEKIRNAALKDVMTTPFFHSSLALHGLAFLAAFREEITNCVLFAMAKGDKKRYFALQKALTEIKNWDSVKVVSDVGEMGLRVVVPRDLQFTESTTHMAKDFVKIVCDLQKTPEMYWNIMARAIDVAASNFPDYVPAIPYVSISGLSQLLKNTYAEHQKSHSKLKTVSSFVDNLPLLIPGSRAVLDSLERLDNSKKITPAAISSASRGQFDVLRFSQVGCKAGAPKASAEVPANTSAEPTINQMSQTVAVKRKK